MDTVGISKDEQLSIIRIASAILHLQNVVFKPCKDDHDRCIIVDKKPLIYAAELLRIQAQELEKALMTFTRVIMNKPIVSDLSADKATDARDALSKHLYANMFNWIVEKINSHVSSPQYHNFIGLLDIFGFEWFEVNSFEQLCINYTNESLQGHYNSHVFKRDMEECEREGIDTSELIFNDNQPCIELLQGRNGIMSILDDQCNIPRSSDSTFMDKLRSQFKDHPYLSTNPLHQDQFSIRHYAGTVTYTVDGWLDKNRDLLKDDLEDLLRSSGDAIVRQLVPTALSSEAAQSSRRRRLTLTGAFKRQLIDLLNMIDSTDPSWIRCIKPHKSKKPNMFDGIEVINQLRSSGVLETIRIRREGFAVRITKKDLWKRYRNVAGMSTEFKPPQDDYTIGAKLVFEAMEWNCKNRAQIGKTKVFLKTEVFSDLEVRRTKGLIKHIQTIQRVARGYLARKQCWEMLAHIRAEKERKLEEERRRREEQERLEREERERKERLEREERERREREERERREREEQERRAREEAERAALLEIKRATEERLRREREAIERELNEKREREILERSRLEELERLQQDREARLAKLAEEQLQKERELREKQVQETKRVEQERQKAARLELEKKRLKMREQEQVQAEMEKQESIRRQFEQYMSLQSQRDNIERERQLRKKRARKKIEQEKRQRIEEMKARRLEEQVQRQYLDQKLQKWEQEEEARLQKKLQDSQSNRIATEERNLRRKRRVEIMNNLQALKAEEHAYNIEHKQAMVSQRRAEMEAHRRMLVEEQRQREHEKQELIARLRREEQMVNDEKRLRWQWLHLRDQREKKLNDRYKTKSDLHRMKLLKQRRGHFDDSHTFFNDWNCHQHGSASARDSHGQERRSSSSSSTGSGDSSPNHKKRSPSLRSIHSMPSTQTGERANSSRSLKSLRGSFSLYPQ